MWPNLQFPANLVIFTEEILNGKLHFLGSDSYLYQRLTPNTKKSDIFAEALLLLGMNYDVHLV